MNIGKTDIIAKIRKAIDDVVPTATDSFTNDTDNELWQAVFQAVQALLEELPLKMMNPSSGNLSVSTVQDGGSDIVLPAGFLRFVNVRLTGWTGPLGELMEPDSDDARRQRSPWSRGTVEKPKAMIHHNASGALILSCWPSGEISILNYIPKAEATADIVTCALKDETERLVIFRAAAIFFEGKKEPDTAAKFTALATTTE